MRFELTEEQRALAEVARGLFAAESDAARLRSVWDADGDRDVDLWPRFAELGLTGVCVPTDAGGSGGGLVDLILVAEESGYAAVPEPLLDSAAVAAPLLAEAGTDAHRDRWLPALAAGDAVAAVGLAGQPYVVDADRADVLLLEADGDVRLCLPGDVELRRVHGEDRARRLFTVERSDGEELPAAAAARAHRRARTVTAATLNGVSRRLVDMAVDYAEVREQFDRPIGSFQAIQHLLADLHVAVESVRGAAWYAAYAVDRDQPDAGVAARVAKAAAAQAARDVNAGALQVFGGIGFTWEHDLHLWLKRGKALEGAHGTAREHRRELAAHLLEQGA